MTPFIMVSVTCATSMALPCEFSMTAQSPSLMPAAAASSGWMANIGHLWNSRMRGSCRCSEWKYSQQRRPVVMTSGYSAASSGVLTGLSGGSLK